MSIDLEIISVSEGAKILKVSRSTMYSYIQRKLVPHLRVGQKGRIMLDKNALLRWADRRIRESCRDN
jgi:excisionase family DNA binding protein